MEEGGPIISLSSVIIHARTLYLYSLLGIKLLNTIWLTGVVSTYSNLSDPGLNAYTLYVVEDITGTHTDPYHYKMYFHTEFPIDVETKP